MNARALSYRPEATIRWVKDGTQVSGTSQSGRILTISDVTATDAGTYTCEASQVTSSGTNVTPSSGQLEVIGE